MEGTNYGTYEMRLFEKILYILAATLFFVFIAYVFFRSFFLGVLFSPLALLYPKRRTVQIIEKRKNELNLQFKDMLYALSSSLSAGSSIEYAFMKLPSDLSILYPGKDSFIMKEAKLVSAKLDMNETIESVLEDFAERAHIEDIENFSEVFSTCKRTGGNLVEVMKNTSNIINDRIEIREEMRTMLAEKRFEQKVLNIMPLFLVIILSVSSPEYMEPVFTTVLGRIAMFFSVLLFGAAYLISQKISKIEV